ncbi:uncharacterized protein DS421_20g687940 [Arachis hypogaea]|nr:uncharacterized protein DS421_20g687940 [Arachis hypogaea]
MPYLTEPASNIRRSLRTSFLDNTLISAFIESCHLETHTFHLSWEECIITLQDMTYHLGMHIDKDLIGGCMRNFQPIISV